MKILFVYLFQALLQLIYLPLKAFCKVQDQVVYLSRQTRRVWICSCWNRP